MVDRERLDRLLDRVASYLKVLEGYRAAQGSRLSQRAGPRIHRC